MSHLVRVGLPVVFVLVLLISGCKSNAVDAPAWAPAVSVQLTNPPTRNIPTTLHAVVNFTSPRHVFFQWHLPDTTISTEYSSIKTSFRTAGKQRIKLSVFDSTRRILLCTVDTQIVVFLFQVRVTPDTLLCGTFERCTFQLSADSLGGRYAASWDYDTTVARLLEADNTHLTLQFVQEGNFVVAAAVLDQVSGDTLGVAWSHVGVKTRAGGAITADQPNIVAFSQVRFTPHVDVRKLNGPLRYVWSMGSGGDTVTLPDAQPVDWNYAYAGDDTVRLQIFAGSWLAVQCELPITIQPRLQGFDPALLPNFKKVVVRFYADGILRNPMVGNATTPKFLWVGDSILWNGLSFSYSKFYYTSHTDTGVFASSQTSQGGVTIQGSISSSGLLLDTISTETSDNSSSSFWRGTRYSTESNDDGSSTFGGRLNLAFFSSDSAQYVIRGPVTRFHVKPAAFISFEATQPYTYTREEFGNIDWNSRSTPFYTVTFYL